MTGLAAALVASMLVPVAPDGGTPRVPEIAFEKYTLPNGLDVILHEDHASPIVGINLWYHVGSKNERPGRTGFAHLFEHMMFQGSQHHDNDYFGPLQKAGGRLNGSTSEDRTNYWETVPSNYLELALWLESDRMGFLLPAMTQAKLDNQRDVVKNERRQSYENRPYGLAHEVLLAAMYPPEHPYSWPVIGSMTDISAASRDDVAAFFRRNYHPANASLCLAGDFNPAEAKRLVAKYFGPIPAGPKPKRLAAWTPELKEEKRIRMTDRVGLGRLYLTWHSVPQFTADDAALEVLADVLAGGKTSRLYRLLVRERQIAQEVHVMQSSSEIAGAMIAVATVRPGHTLAELETAILDEFRRIQAEPPSADEVARAVNRYQARFFSAIEPISEFGGRADRLNMYNIFTGDPGYLKQDFQHYVTVTPADIQRVAAKYLGPHHVALEVTPGREQTVTPDPRVSAEADREKLAKQAAPTPPVAATTPVDNFDRSVTPGPAAEPQFHLPPIRRSKLSNGMELLVVEHHTVPLLHLNLMVPVGRAQDPLGKWGLASLLTAVWDEGTESRTSMQIAEELAGIGASLSLGSDWDTSGVRLFTLKQHLGRAVELFCDVIEHPTFPEAELARERAMALGRLVQARDEPTVLASLAISATLYGPEHPYGRPQTGTPSTLRAISRDDLVAAYRSYVRPDQATLIVVGDITLEEAKQEFEKRFAGWKAPSGESPKRSIPPAAPTHPTRIVLVDKPGAPQSVVSLGLLGFSRTSPDYFPLAVMNSILGGQFSSRLNMNLREEKGYTYGARTMFDWHVCPPCPLVGIASVQTAVTAPALTECFKEYRGMLGKRPVDQAELDFSKRYITRGYPAAFETTGQIASQLEVLVQYALSDDYFNTVVPKISAVTLDDVARVAAKHLDVDHLAVIVVGDRTKIEASLRALPEGKDLSVVGMDEDFRLVPISKTPDTASPALKGGTN